MDWKRSSRCVSGDCVEVAWRDGMIRVRDGKDPDGPILTFTAAEWMAFTEGVTAGEFGLP